MEYMTWENRWHDATYHVVFPVFERRFPNDNVASHRAVQVFNRNIVLAYPDRYLVWLAKAARRAAWVIAADIVMHPIALLLIVLAIAAVLLRTATGRGLPDLVLPPGFHALLVVSLTYVVSKTAFVIITSPPIGRFSDAAAILLPACIVAVLVPWFYRWTQPTSESL